MRRILRGLGIAVLALAATYVADNLSLRFHIPASRQAYGSVQVQTLYAVRQKNGRLEYSLGDTTSQTCVRSLFPQFGLTPCWYLSRHATQQIQIGRRGMLPFAPAFAAALFQPY